MKCKYALDKPTILKIWLIQDEIKFLEEARFVLNKQKPIFLKVYSKGKAPFL
jgi:hypothetical protein